MLHLLLLILKILGILLLVILGIILTVLLLVLFVPLRYQANAEFDGNPKGDVLLSWLLHLVTVRVSYDGSIGGLVKILWFKVFETSIGGVDENEDESEDTEPEPTEAFAEDEFPKDEFISVEKPEKVTCKPETVKLKNDPKPEPQAQHEENTEKIPFTEMIFEKLRAIVSKIKEKIAGVYQNLVNKAQGLQEKIEPVRSFLEDEENQNTIRLIWGQVFKLFRHILPRKLRGRVRFGFEDPNITGKVLTYISPFYGLYAKTMKVEPVFGEKVIEGEVHLKGHIRAASMLWIVIRLFLNKNFRKILRKLTGKKK